MRKSLLDALFPKTRQAILSACLLHPERWWYLSALAGYLKLSPSSLQRELASLVSVNLLQIRKEGNRVYYQANLECPGVDDLQALLIKTAGLREVLITNLKNFFSQMDWMFIYGSFARGELIAGSDVDLMIVGDLRLSAIIEALRKIEKKIGREVNVTNYSANEFAKKWSSGDSFLRTVIEDKTIFVVGSERDFRREFPVAEEGQIPDP